MQNLINWFEIPASDINRAIAFYKAILSVEIEETEMFGAKMGFFPSDGTNVSDGVLAYLNGGNDLQNVLDNVEKNNGKVILPKTQISIEMGYFAIFIDTEGNKMAVHSIN